MLSPDLGEGWTAVGRSRKAFSPHANGSGRVVHPEEAHGTEVGREVNATGRGEGQKGSEEEPRRERAEKMRRGDS